MAVERRWRGWIGTLAGLLVLVVVGFVGGALAGFLWEEPRLVVAYLTGRTERVDWSAPPALPEEEVPEAPTVAAPPPLERPVATPAAETPREDPAPPVRSAGRPEDRFAVQVGAFGERAAAERLAGQLRERGYETYLASDDASGTVRWRVRVGPVPARGRAEALAQRLERDEKLPTWVLEEREGAP